MAKKKKSDRPKHVSIYYDQLLYDLDFMPNENAGIILKLIVWYAVGTPESKAKIDEMLEHIKTLPDCGWLTSLYHRLCSAIDEDLQAYADVCEKRRQAVAKREEYKKEREMSLGINKEQMISNDNNSNHKISNTDTEYDTDTVTDTESSTDDIYIADAFVPSQRDFEKIDFDNPPELNDLWIENLLFKVKEATGVLRTSEWVKALYKEFLTDLKLDGVPHDYQEFRIHFKNWILHKSKLQNETSNSRQTDLLRQAEAKPHAAEEYEKGF